MSAHDRGVVIDKYYADLEYGLTQNTQTEALKDISSLADKMEFTDVNDFSERFLKAASVIEENLTLFKASCTHPDIITTIIKYLNYFGAKFQDSKYDEDYEKDDIVLLAIFTIMKIHDEYEIQILLENAIIKNSDFEKSDRYKHLINKIRCHTHEMILLADSDVYAVIRYLRNIQFFISNMSKSYNSQYIQFLFTNKIWVQEPIKDKFLSLVKNIGWTKTYCSQCIYTFRKKEELFTPSTPNTMNIVSIWTEDIVFATNLAMSLNRDVVFINTHMDFYDSIVLLPYIEIFDDTLHKWCWPNFDNSIKNRSVEQNSIHNLFYDGMWQHMWPVKDILNDSRLTNAISDDDIYKCINSAQKGFKIWSNESCRRQILLKFASTVLKYTHNSELTNVISKWIKFSCVYENSFSQSGSLGVRKIREPRGIIILKEEEKAVLFCRLLQILIAGNSVIVICDTDFYSLVPYCNMFAVSKIPPGVINLLSSKDINKLELFLCGMDYASYAKQLFSEDNLEKTYINLTKSKQIILPLK